MFNLAITFGLKREPLAALERLKGLVEDVGRRHGVEYPLQMTLGLSYGQRLYAVRYSSEPSPEAFVTAAACKRCNRSTLHAGGPPRGGARRYRCRSCAHLVQRVPSAVAMVSTESHLTGRQLDYGSDKCRFASVGVMHCCRGSALIISR